MKLFLTLCFLITGLIALVLAAPGDNSYDPSSRGNVAPSQPNYSTHVTPTPSEEEEQKDAGVGDDSLYRGSTKDSLGQPALRDEGPMHEKTHPNEKVIQVDSRKLPSSGTDPKFQTSFLTSGANAIEDVAPKVTPKTNKSKDLTKLKLPDLPKDPFQTNQHSLSLNETGASNIFSAPSKTEPSPTATPTATPSPQAEKSAGPSR